MKYFIAFWILVSIGILMPESPPPVVEPAPVVVEYTIPEPPAVGEVQYLPHIQEVVWVDDGSWDYAKNYVPFTVEEAMDVFHSVRPGRWVVR